MNSTFKLISRFTWANKFPNSSFNLLENKKFDFSKFLGRPKNKCQLLVNNVLFDQRESIYLEYQMKQTFPKQTSIQLNSQKATAIVTFANEQDAEESFYETGDSVIKGLLVTVCFNREFVR